MIINTFTGRITSKYVAMDTETHTYVDGQLLTENQIRQMCAQTRVRRGNRELVYPVSWWREHCTVKCWAYIIYAPEGFAIAETFEEFKDLCTRLHIRHGWFYNAPFDFSILDYDLLSRGYEHTDKIKAPMQYDEMCNDFGARYRMRICFPYEPAEGERSTRTKWTVSMYDLRNIFPGGLAANLETFKVKDTEGIDIRKRKMDYQSGTITEDDILYMKADAAGLWHLIETSGTILKQKYNVSICDGKPEVYTASSIAKRYVLSEMYPGNNWSYTLKKFKRDHPMSIEDDIYFREHGLLGGGRVFVNPAFRYQHISGRQMWRYDANSHYPAYMSDMLSVYGFPEWFKTYDQAREFYPDDACYIFMLKEFTATMKDNAIPAWRNPWTCNIEDIIFHDSTSFKEHGHLLIFKEEVEELANWYDFTALKIDGVIVYKTRKEPAIERVMRTAYAEKAKAKAEKDKAGQQGPKLIMCGYGGKYSQNPNRKEITRELNEYVQRIEVSQKCDPKALMQVVQGARITCNGRVRLMQAARRICKEDMRHNLLYGDTDSLHTFTRYAGSDPYKLGEFKQENETPIIRAAFIAPKTYYEIEEGGKIELHAKGVRIEDIKKLLDRGVPIEKIYSPGYSVQSLTSLNVPGGKALLPFPKYIMRPQKKGKESPTVDELFDEKWD